MNGLRDELNKLKIEHEKEKKELQDQLTTLKQQQNAFRQVAAIENFFHKQFVDLAQQLVAPEDQWLMSISTTLIWL